MTDTASGTPLRGGQIRRPDAMVYAEAARILRAGGLVAFPTETVYGLGADATDDKAVAAIFEAKGRPRFNPLIVHFADAEAAAGEVAFDARARALAQAFWPGPLSLVLARAPACRVSLLCSAGLATLAVRVPKHGVGQALLRAVGRPLAAPSANPSGALSPTTAAHVAESLGDKVPLILDGGPCPVGLESTVLDLSGADPVLLRPGGVTAEALEPFVGRVLRADHDKEIKSPGMLMSHYAPDRPDDRLQHFCRDRAGAQQHRVLAAQVEHRGFEPDRAGAAVEDHRHLGTERSGDVGRGGRAEGAGGIGAGRGQGTSGRRLSGIGKMHDQRIESRPALGFENRRHGAVAGGVGAEPVNRLGRERDQPARAQDSRGLGIGCRVGLADACIGRGHVTATRLRGGAVY